MLAGVQGVVGCLAEQRLCLPTARVVIASLWVFCVVSVVVCSGRVVGRGGPGALRSLAALSLSRGCGLREAAAVVGPLVRAATAATSAVVDRT